MSATALAILWHQHQPYYPDDLNGDVLMPWVRLHGVKSYIGMALHLQEVPRRLLDGLDERVPVPGLDPQQLEHHALPDEPARARHRLGRTVHSRGAPTITTTRLRYPSERSRRPRG